MSITVEDLSFSSFLPLSTTVSPSRAVFKYSGGCGDTNRSVDVQVAGEGRNAWLSSDGMAKNGSRAKRLHFARRENEIPLATVSS